MVDDDNRLNPKGQETVDKIIVISDTEFVDDTATGWTDSRSGDGKTVEVDLDGAGRSYNIKCIKKLKWCIKKLKTV